MLMQFIYITSRKEKNQSFQTCSNYIPRQERPSIPLTHLFIQSHH